MATRSNYRERLRKRLRDYPKRDILAAAIVSTSATTFTATTAAVYDKGGVVKIDSEEMLVRDISGTTITVIRGWNATTAATHVINSVIYIFRFMSDEEMNQYIESGIRDLYPDIYAEGIDISVTLVASTYSYSVPATITTNQGEIIDIQYYTSTEPRGVAFPYEVWAGTIYIQKDYDATARIKYIYPYAVPTDDGTDLAIPTKFDEIILAGAELEAMQAMMTDRAKYEKYVASQYQENATGYELESHLRTLRLKVDGLHDELRMAKPPVRRWV